MIAAQGMDSLPATALAQAKALVGKHKTVIPSGAASGRSLYAVIAVMCYLASITLGLTLTVRQLAHNYSKDLSGAITIQLKYSDAVDREQQFAQALSVLNDPRWKNSFYDIKPMAREKAEAAIATYIGRGNLPDDIRMRIPQLIEIRINPDRRPDLAALGEVLRAQVPGAELNDHSQWKAQLLAFSSSLQGLSVAALALIIFAAVAIVAFATRAAMAANKELVEVMHFIGAEDRFIAAEFQGHFLRMGLWAGLLGAIVAAFTLWGLGSMVGQGAEFFIPGLALRWDAYLSLIFVPLLSGIVAMITARLTALSVIGRVL